MTPTSLKDRPRLSEHVLPKLHDRRTGRLNAAQLAAFFDLSPEEIAPTLGVSGKTIRRQPAGKKIQESLITLASLASHLASLLGEEGARAWLHSPHPLLDERMPIALIKEKKADIVLDLVIAAERGQTT